MFHLRLFTETYLNDSLQRTHARRFCHVKLELFNRYFVDPSKKVSRQYYPDISMSNCLLLVICKVSGGIFRIKFVNYDNPSM